MHCLNVGLIKSLQHAALFNSYRPHQSLPESPLPDSGAFLTVAVILSVQGDPDLVHEHLIRII